MSFINKVFKNKTIINILLVTFLFVALFFVYENKVSYIHFVDEEENMVSGKYLLEGEKLNKNIFAQHQPITYIISAGVQKVFKPSSIFLLIKRHREFIVAWSFLWSILLVTKFGLWTTGFIVCYELTKIFLLGNLFLAESLVVYPLVFLVGTLLSDKRILKTLELVFLGGVFALAAFLLSPMWPLLAFLFIVLVFRLKVFDKENLLKIFTGAFAVLFFVLLFVSIPGYFRETILFNTKYFIPLNPGLFGLITIFKSFFAFVISLIPNIQNSPSLTVIRLFSVTLMAILLTSLVRKKNIFVLIFIILGLANIRYIQPGLEYYRGFHILIWFALLIFSVFWGLNYLSKELKGKYFKIGFKVLMLPLIIVCLNLSRKELFIKRDVKNDYYVNYSKQFDLGEAVRILKNKNDTLFVAPDESLIFWQADISKASRFVFYYPFMENALYTMSEVEEMFKNNPPTFFYCRCADFSKLPNYLTSYKEIKKDGKPTDLFIRLDRVGDIDKEQFKNLDYYRFSL